MDYIASMCLKCMEAVTGNGITVKEAETIGRSIQQRFRKLQSKLSEDTVQYTKILSNFKSNNGNDESGRWLYLYEVDYWDMDNDGYASEDDARKLSALIGDFNKKIKAELSTKYGADVKLFTAGDEQVEYGIEFKPAMDEGDDRAAKELAADIRAYNLNPFESATEENLKDFPILKKYISFPAIMKSVENGKITYVVAECDLAKMTKDLQTSNEKAFSAGAEIHETLLYSVEYFRRRMKWDRYMPQAKVFYDKKNSKKVYRLYTTPNETSQK